MNFERFARGLRSAISNAIEIGSYTIAASALAGLACTAYGVSVGMNSNEIIQNLERGYELAAFGAFMVGGKKFVAENNITIGKNDDYREIDYGPSTIRFLGRVVRG